MSPQIWLEIMRDKKLSGLLLLIAVQLIGTAVSQSGASAAANSKNETKKTLPSTLETLMVEAETNYNHGRYAEALGLFEQAKADTSASSYQRSQINLGLAESYRSMGRLKESEDLFLKSISEAEQEDSKHLNKRAKINEKNSSDTIPYMLNDLAILYLQESRFSEAEQMAKKCIDLGIKKVGTKNTILSLPYNVLTRIYLKWGKLAQAKSINAKTLQLFTNEPSKQNWLYAYTAFNLAQILDQEGQYQKAEKLYKATLLGIESIFGFEHSHCAVILEPMGELYRKQGKYAEATKAFQRVRKIRAVAYSKTHADYGKALLDLSLVARDEGRYPRAQELCKQATTIITNALGQENIEAANCAITAASIFRYQGKYAEAEEQAKQAMKLDEKLLSKNTPSYAHDMTELADIYADEEKTEDAKSLLEQALKIDQTTLGEDHPDIAKINRSLASIYFFRHDFAKSNEFYTSSQSITEKSYGADNADVLSDSRRLADIAIAQNKFQDAIPYLNKALKIDENLYTKKSAQYARDLDALAQNYLRLNDKTQAAPLLTAYSELKQSLPGAEADSKYSELKLTPNPLKDRTINDKWAIVIGISNFKDPSINLKYAAKDATDFRNFLVAKENFKSDHVQLLTDADATKEKIISKLGDGWLGRVAKKDDLVLVYVSSHGSAEQDGLGINFLVTHDTDKFKLVSTGLPLQWLTKIVQEQVHSGRVVVILDVCHSGAAAAMQAPAGADADAFDEDDLDSQSTTGSKGLQRGRGVNTAELSLGTGQIILCSSLANQVSWESKNYPNSVFTRKLIEALQFKGRDTTLTQAYEQLRAAVNAEVLGDRGALQTPDLANKNWTGGDPVLGVPTKTKK